MAETSGALLRGNDLRAWKGLLRTHAALTHELAAALERDHGLALGEYEVLMLLADAGKSGLRMSEIADQVLVSRSGLTRLIDRLVKRGLVDRRPCKDDARGYVGHLTAAGAGKLGEARPDHLARVRELFHSRLDAEQLDALADIWSALLEPTSDGPAET